MDTFAYVQPLKGSFRHRGYAVARRGLALLPAWQHPLASTTGRACLCLRTPALRKHVTGTRWATRTKHACVCLLLLLHGHASCALSPAAVHSLPVTGWMDGQGARNTGANSVSCHSPTVHKPAVPASAGHVQHILQSGFALEKLRLLGYVAKGVGSVGSACAHSAGQGCNHQRCSHMT